MVKKRTGKRVKVFIWLKILEILLVLAIIFLPFLFGNYLINRETCNTDIKSFTCAYYDKCLDISPTGFSCYKGARIQISSKPIIWGLGFSMIIAYISSLIGVLIALVVLYFLIESWVKYNWKKAGEIVNKK